MEYKLQKKPNEWEQNVFTRYETVRSKGKYNMVTEANKAMKAAGLNEDEYWFVIFNYDELQKRYGGR